MFLNRGNNRGSKLSLAVLFWYKFTMLNLKYVVQSEICSHFKKYNGSIFFPMNQTEGAIQRGYVCLINITLVPNSLLLF